MPWAVRTYRPGDETALVSLFARVFGRPISEAHWRWKLAAHAAPMPNVFVATAGDAAEERLVFQCAGIPIRYAGPDGQVTAIVAVDAMTDPAFRRQGLLTDVTRRAYDVWRAAGVPFVIGLPNDQWGSRTSALGWLELFPLTWRVRLLRPERIIARRFGPWVGRVASPVGAVWCRFWRSRGAADSAIAVRRVTAADAFDRFWASVERHRGPRTTYSIVRDRRWIEWRYLSAPDDEYVIWLAERGGEPVGHCVARRLEDGGRRTGAIAEFSAVNDDAAVYSRLLQVAVADLDREGADLVSALAMPGTPADVALRRAGFVFSWGSFTVQMVPLQGQGPLPFSEIFGGDFDVV